MVQQSYSQLGSCFTSSFGSVASPSTTGPSNGLLHHVTLRAIQGISQLVAELWTKELLDHRLLCSAPWGVGVV